MCAAVKSVKHNPDALCYASTAGRAWRRLVCPCRRRDEPGGGGGGGSVSGEGQMRHPRFRRGLWPMKLLTQYPVYRLLFCRKHSGHTSHPGVPASALPSAC